MFEERTVMSAQIIDFPMDRIRKASTVAARVQPQSLQPQVRTSVRIARKLIVWGVLLVTGYFMIFGQSSSVQSAEATSSVISSASAKNFTYVTVQSGDSLWGIAERNAGGRDIRDFVQEIIALNNMQDSVVEAGMRLAIPRS